jgi:hypothetical protein
VTVAPTFFRKGSVAQERLLARASDRYGRFLGLTATFGEPRQVKRVGRDR